MPTAGYAHLIERHSLSCLRPAVPAEVKPVTRIVRSDDEFLVPRHVAPAPDAPTVEHLLFALRYEGLDLAVIDALAAAGALTAAQVREANLATPMGAFARKLGFAWELVTGQEIQDVAPLGGYADMFDPELYYTGARPQRNVKWRVDFNGLGVPAYCPVIRRTAELDRLLQRDLIAEVHEFAQAARDQGVLDRILSWAYLDETKSSFEIEGEDPPLDKQQAFAAVLKNAHDAGAINEQYLVELQNLIITNPLWREAAYRGEQNWLARGGRGAAQVRYVPPAPGALPALMAGLEQMCNAPQADNPLLHATLCSFGFVYLHPFMDGNGRLSRFLFHHALCVKRALPDGLILPVSIAMHRNEQGYLQALESFSRQARQFWDVRWIDGNNFDFTARCRDSVYRYWDATAQAEFSVRMAAQAMDVDLLGEAHYLASFDRAFKALDRKLDLPAPLLHKLIVMCQEQRGVVSNNRRKQFKDTVPVEYFDEIEKVVSDAFGFLEDTGSAVEKPSAR
ncbi:MAG: Filamentation induced by cAMP protein Fic [Ramlibacter sp.]|jgi:Fic family protein|nr:Filamentation induced by cAMP protein Fic [Ramlibacter sp.]